MSIQKKSLKSSSGNAVRKLRSVAKKTTKSPTGKTISLKTLYPPSPC